MTSNQMSEMGNRLRRLRLESGVGLRELCRLADMSPAALSAIEKGTSSPTLATLHKILKALNSDFAQFFASPSEEPNCPVVKASQMRQITDEHRLYTIIFPRRDDLRFNMLRETLNHDEADPEWESHDCDLGGLVIKGGAAQLEIDGHGQWTLHKGDAYYIKAGQRHRLCNQGKTALEQITVMDPPRY